MAFTISHDQMEQDTMKTSSGENVSTHGQIAREKSPAVDVDISEESNARKWNSSPTNTLRVLVAIFSFIVLGMSDAAYGALIPYIEGYYRIGYTPISIVFLSPFVGYIFSAMLSNSIHQRYGQRGIAFLAPLCKIIAYVVIVIHPPFPVIPVVYIFCGLGNGLEDGAWNAWIGNMDSANEVLGFLHAAYGLGATIGPLIATAMVTKAGLMWFDFYYLMVGMATLEWGLCIYAFRSADSAYYRSVTASSSEEEPQASTSAALRNPITWLAALFLFVNTGVEVGVGGWLATFMLYVRHGSNFASGMAVVGYWLGMTVGRLTLGFITGRIGERLAVSIYLVVTMGLELCFWLIPSFISSAIFVAWLGFFIGPMFPAAIVVATNFLPKGLHVPAIGFAAAAGSGGGAVLPFAIGAIAQRKGVEVLQPIILALIVTTLMVWLVLSAGFKGRR